MIIQSISQLSGFRWEDFHLLSSKTTPAYVEIVYPKTDNETKYESYKFPLNMFFNYLVSELTATQKKMEEYVNTACTKLRTDCEKAHKQLSARVDERLTNYVYLVKDDLHEDDPQIITSQKTFNAHVDFENSIDVKGAASIGGGTTIDGALEVNNTAVFKSSVNIEGNTTINSGKLTIGSDDFGSPSVKISDGNLTASYTIKATKLDSVDINNSNNITTNTLNTKGLTASTTPAMLTAYAAWWR